MSEHDMFDSLSPLDYRYQEKAVAEYLSENGFTRYKLKVEQVLIVVFQRRGLCNAAVVAEIAQACQQITTAEVYTEEKRVGHDIRALVNCIRSKVSDNAKPFVHMVATSFDIVDTANAARYRDCMQDVIIPSLLALEQVLIELAVRERSTAQIGRTHGQHAVPITFGFAIAEYVSRLGQCILKLGQLVERLDDELVGKFSGAVGAYNASSLFFDDPEKFEDEVLAALGLRAADHSTQIVQPEPLARLLFECVLIAGVMANLARDMRHLQRTEIGEVAETFGDNQVGSSTMPQKRNPIGFENVESCWKIIVGRMTTVLMDQLSEHQRDLTNSASARTYPEIVGYLVAMARRLTWIMGTLKVDKARMQENVGLQGDLIAAEPLYLVLAAGGHPDAHEAVRQLTLDERRRRASLYELAMADEELAPFLSQLTERQERILENPELYVGIAAKRTIAVTKKWATELGLPYEDPK